MTLIEIIRLFLGYAGNLQEKVLHHSHKHKQQELIIHVGFIILYTDCINLHSAKLFGITYILVAHSNMDLIIVCFISTLW